MMRWNEEGAVKKKSSPSWELEGTLALEVFVMEIEKKRRELFESGYLSETCPGKNDRYEAALGYFLIPRFPNGL